MAPRTDDQAARSQWLLHIRRWLAERGHHAPTDPAVAAVWQTLAQFCAGFQDMNLRDATGPGHGSMILHEAPPATADAWDARLNRGDLVGIAATERHGGSRIRDITTRARLAPGGPVVDQRREGLGVTPDGNRSGCAIARQSARSMRRVAPPVRYACLRQFRRAGIAIKPNSSGRNRDQNGDTPQRRGCPRRDIAVLDLLARVGPGHQP